MSEDNSADDYARLDAARFCCRFNLCDEMWALVASGTPEVVLTDSVLGEVYDAPVKTMRSDGRTFVWSEL